MDRSAVAGEVTEKKHDFVFTKDIEQNYINDIGITNKQYNASSARVI